MRDMSRFLASCAFALACLAIGLRVAAPPGFMLAAPDAGRGSAIVLCTGQGPQTLAPDVAASDPRGAPAGTDGAPHDGDPAHGPCVFAGLGPALADAPAPLLAEIAWPHVNAAGAPQPRSRLGAGLSAPPPPQTGPPGLA